MYLVRTGGGGGKVPSGLHMRKMSVFCTLWMEGEYESSTWKKSVGFLAVSSSSAPDRTASVRL